MTDADVAETLAAHADEIADFDAQLYPKPWRDDEGPVGYAHRIMLEHHRRVGTYPQRFRCSSLYVRATMESQRGERRFTLPSDGLAITCINGVATFVDDGMTGYRLEVDA